MSRPGHPAEGSTYVVCLDCGKHFDYDPVEMRILRPSPVNPTELTAPKQRLKRALWASLPLVVLIGSLFRRSRRRQQRARIE